MSRWTRDQEDIDRLPHGMRRTAYDADTQQYTFLDTTDGTYYVSAPGQRYGTLVPEATANFPKVSRTSGRRPTLQAYDRPVLFADDLGYTDLSMGHKRNPTMPISSRHHSKSSSGSTRKGSRKRSASFSDFVPAHLIARATTESPPELSAPVAKRPPEGRTIKSKSALPSAPSPSPPPPAYGDEKKSTSLLSPTGTDTDAILSSLPTLSASPPPLPPKDYPVSSPQQKRQQSSGEIRMPHVAMRLTARVRGRTLGAVKSGERSSKGQSGDDEWIIV